MNNYFIVGSTVMKAHGFRVDPKDFDVFYLKGTKKPDLSVKTRLKVEYHAIPFEIFSLFVASGFDHGPYVNLETLYILKLSHAEYDIHWQKTVNHIQLLKRVLKDRYWARGDVFSSLPKHYHELFYLLKDYWKTIHKSKKRITLKMPKDKFFNNKVKRKYDHDFLHEVVKYNRVPMYKKCLMDGAEVMLDENKFNNLSYAEKLQLCREEIYVIALERFLIPNDFSLCEHDAYKMALKKVVTRMTKGWFPTFIVDNYNVLCKIDKNYMKIFQQKVNSNVRNA